MSKEFIPTYPTLAFATRRDHEIWIEANKVAAEQAATEITDQIQTEDVALPALDSTSAEAPAEPEAPAPSSRRKRSTPAEPEAPAPDAAE